MMQYAGELQQLWDNALADTAAKPKEKRSGSGKLSDTQDTQTRYSIRPELKDELEKVKSLQFDSNSKEVLIGDTSDFLVNKLGFKPLPNYMPATKAYRAIVSTKQAAKDGQPTGKGIHYHGLGVNKVYDILERAETPQTKYGLAEEYVKSTYSRWLKDNSKSTFRAKMKAAGVLDELVSIASEGKQGETKHSHNKDAQYGVDTYKSSFAFPVKNNTGNIANVRAYDRKLIVLNASDGKKYLYDVTGIKENTSKAKDVLLSERQRAAYKAARQTGVGDNISHPDAEVNSKYSNRERDTEYMEAVNAGDTETAQRLVDEAAADAGYSVHAYHGTPNGTCHVFNGWSYFTESKDYADVYKGRGASVNYKKTADNPKTYDIYLDPKNVFDTRNQKEADIFWDEFYRKWGNGAPLRKQHHKHIRVGQCKCMVEKPNPSRKRVLCI